MRKTSGGAPGAAPAYLYGSDLQVTGAGPFIIPSTLFPQFWRYIGTAAVVLELPNGAAGASNTGSRAWLFVASNEGTGAASVDVQDASAATIVTLAIGDTAILAWDDALLTWTVLGTFGGGGGGVGPGTPDFMAIFDGAGTNVADGPAWFNGFEFESLSPFLASDAAQINDYLDLWLDVDAGNSLNVSGRDATLATVYGELFISVAGSNDQWFTGTVAGDSAILPQPGTGGGALHIGSGMAPGGVAELVIREDGTGIDLNAPLVMGTGQLVQGKNQIPARFVNNNNATIDADDDGIVTIVITSGVGRTATLPLIVAGMVGRSYTIANRTPSGSSAAVTIAASGGQTISGGTALGEGIAWTYYAIETSAGVYQWIREQ